MLRSQTPAPKIYQITEPRDGYLYSTYFQVLDDDSDSSSEATFSGDSKWVAFPLASYYDTQEVHGEGLIQKKKKKKEKKSKHKKHHKAHEKSIEQSSTKALSHKSCIPKTFCLILSEEDQYSLVRPKPIVIPFNPQEKNSCKDSPESEEYGSVSKKKNKSPLIAIPLKLELIASDDESVDRIFPHQRRTRSTQRTGSFSGSNYGMSTQEVSLERKPSILKTKTHSEVMRSRSMHTPRSRRDSFNYSTAYDARLKEIQIEALSSAGGSKRSGKHGKKNRKSCYGIALIEGHFD